jgi:hypothetical protein
MRRPLVLVAICSRHWRKADGQSSSPARRILGLVSPSPSTYRRNQRNGRIEHASEPGARSFH